MVKGFFTILCLGLVLGAAFGAGIALRNRIIVIATDIHHAVFFDIDFQPTKHVAEATEGLFCFDHLG